MSQVCPNCGVADRFVEDRVRGDTICFECGCCLPDRVIDDALEKRNFMDSGKDHNRGAELDKFLNFASQSTVIGTGRGKLQQAQNRLNPASMSTLERNLTGGFQNLRTFETMFSLPRSVINTSRDMMAQYEKKKDKTLHGARSEAFALGIIFLAMTHHNMGRPLKEVCAVAKVEEREIRKYIKRIQKTIPEALAKSTAADMIRVIISDIEGPFLLERVASEIAQRALNHACRETCPSEYLEGKRTSSIAAAAVLLAAKYCNVTVSAEDVSGSAQVSVATSSQISRLIEQHWGGMFADEPADKVFKNMAELAQRLQKEGTIPADNNKNNNNNDNKFKDDDE